MERAYDAVMLVSFGGPEKPDDVLPFLENVLRGKNVPPERMREAAEHYHLFGGASPINAQNRALVAALVDELNRHGPHLPVYWGNRNWHPLLPDTVRQMADDGVQHALAFVTSAFASYSGCRQYLEDIERARREVGPRSPRIDKLRLFYNHPGFIEPVAQRVGEALDRLPAAERAATPLLLTAHSLPLAMATKCAYVDQLTESCRLVARRLGRSEWELVYQSRSGPPTQPWLEPDIGDRLIDLCRSCHPPNVIVAPIGFLCEHMEVVYDLDVEVAALCEELGIRLVRSAVVGCHPRFVSMIRELIEERLTENPRRLALGEHGPSHDVCPADCCPPR